MWERLTGWIRGLFGIKREDLQSVVGALLTSAEMWKAQDGWLKAFYNVPPWNQDGKTAITGFAGIVSGYAATMAASEILLNPGDGRRADYIKAQIDRYVMPDIRQIIQKAAAGGYVVLKPLVSDGNILCDVIMPDGFYPTRSRGGVFEAGYFVDIKTVGSKTYIRIESHDLQPKGVRITNTAYVDGAVRRGAEVPLSVVSEWAKLSPDATVTGAKQPVYAVLKMPFANQVDPTSKLPPSIYANAIGSLREIDRIYSEFLWEVKTGRRKQIIDVTATAPYRQTGDSGRLPRYFTSDLYLALDMGGAAAKPFDDYTPDMRIEAYQLALNIQLRLLESQCQLSAETFTFDIKSGQAKTATEVVSNDNDTYNTVKAIQENGLKQGLLDLVAIYDLYATSYSLAPGGAIAPSVEFGDSIFEDTGIEFMRRKSLADSEYLRPELLLSWYFGVTEDKAREMMPTPGRAAPGAYGTQLFPPGEDRA